VLINTILSRFAPGGVAHMPQRVQNAQHLGIVLEDSRRTDIPAPDEARAAIGAWRPQARAERTAGPAGAPSRAPDGAGQPLVLHDLQAEVMQFSSAMRHLLPPGQP